MPKDKESDGGWWVGAVWYKVSALRINTGNLGSRGCQAVEEVEMKDPDPALYPLPAERACMRSDVQSFPTLRCLGNFWPQFSLILYI